jgi:Ca2+-binding EF-hand superfamily protein
VDTAWKAFDKDQNGILDKNEINDVIDALLLRVAAEQVAIKVSYHLLGSNNNHLCTHVNG